MQKDRPSVLYIFRGSRDTIPWSEIKRVLVAEFGRDSALTFTVTCSGMDGGVLPQIPTDVATPAAGPTEPSKRPTLAEVAREASVSTTTVSRVINEPWTASEDVRRRVDAAIERLGYQPNETARSLVRRKIPREQPGFSNDADTPVPAEVREFD